MWLIHVLNFFFFLPKLLGSPDDASLGFLRSDNARRYVRQLPQCRKQQLSARFPSMSPGALDLLEKMLVFDPTKRITGTRKEFKFLRETLTGYCFKSFVPLFCIYTFESLAVEEALCHPYLSSLHDTKDEPVSARPFSFDFEQPTCTEEQIKELIWRESVKFNPDPTY